jgi:hypothetical protein
MPPETNAKRVIVIIPIHISGAETLSTTPKIQSMVYIIASTSGPNPIEIMPLKRKSL